MKTYVCRLVTNFVRICRKSVKMSKTFKIKYSHCNNDDDDDDDDSDDD